MKMRVDAVLNPPEIAKLPERDLSGTTCVVFDVLRATSSMITALAHGAEEIHPVATLEEARAGREENRGFLLAGERQGDMPAGFDFGNSPLEFRDVRGARIFWTTTNGTLALRACEAAERVLVGSLLNLEATIEELRWAEPEHLVLVCAGTFETFALEDAYAAGCLAAGLESAELTDAARAVVAVARAFSSPLEALLSSRNGCALVDKGRRAEVEWCARQSVYNVAAWMDGSIVRQLR
jgi:2-phosphosulfolactate phosphatase